MSFLSFRCLIYPRYRVKEASKPEIPMSIFFKKPSIIACSSRQMTKKRVVQQNRKYLHNKCSASSKHQGKTVPYPSLHRRFSMGNLAFHSYQTVTRQDNETPHQSSVGKAMWETFFNLHLGKGSTHLLPTRLPLTFPHAEWFTLLKPVGNQVPAAYMDSQKPLPTAKLRCLIEAWQSWKPEFSRTFTALSTNKGNLPPSPQTLSTRYR